MDFQTNPSRKSRKDLHRISSGIASIMSMVDVGHPQAWQWQWDRRLLCWWPFEVICTAAFPDSGFGFPLESSKENTFLKPRYTIDRLHPVKVLARFSPNLLGCICASVVSTFRSGTWFGAKDTLFVGFEISNPMSSGRSEVRSLWWRESGSVAPRWC